MKTIYIKVLLTFLIAPMCVVNSYSQFVGKDNVAMTACDCNDPLKELWVKIELPEDAGQYTILQYGLYQNDKLITTHNSNPDKLIDGSVSLNLLNPDAKNRRQAFMGRELGLWQGMHFATDYEMICMGGKGEQTLVVKAYGIKQVGINVDYDVDLTYDNKIKIKKNVTPVYDGGVLIAESASLSLSLDPSRAVDTVKKVETVIGWAFLGIMGAAYYFGFM